MMFLFGAIVGAMLASGGAATIPGTSPLGTIPLRCLYVANEADYRDCRWLSMAAEINQQSSIRADWTSVCANHWQGEGVRNWAKPYIAHCDIDKAIAREVV